MPYSEYIWASVLPKVHVSLVKRHDNVKSGSHCRCYKYPKENEKLVLFWSPHCLKNSVDVIQLVCVVRHDVTTRIK